MMVNGSRMNADHPVENVSWHDAVEFANALSAAEGLKPAYVIERNPDESIKEVKPNGPDIYETEGYRLPTEAEWEYAARAGTKTPYWFDADTLDDHAWHSGNSGKRTHAVGNAKHANPWGLHDMLGNVSEWTQDWFGDYPFGAATDPAGSGEGPYRVLRGGSWGMEAEGLRSARRISGVFPDYRLKFLGFRLVRPRR